MNEWPVLALVPKQVTELKKSYFLIVTESYDLACIHPEIRI